MEKVILFGASRKCIDDIYDNNFVNFEIKGIVDNDPKKHGIQICDYKVCPVESIGSIEFDRIIIMSNSVDTIKRQIYNTFGITEDKIMTVKSLGYLSKEMNLGDVSFDTSVRKNAYVDWEYLRNEHLIITNNDLERFYFYEKHRPISKWIHYFSIYEKYFRKFRNKPVKVLEIGVYDGGSLQMWKKYFGVEAQIVGIDIDERCADYDEEQIEIHIGSQDDMDFLNFIKEKYESFDLIIDDGSHKVKHQIASFEALFPILSVNGVYLCEDTHTSYWKKWGGGYKAQGSFIEYAKNMVDGLHMSYFEESVEKMLDMRRNIDSLHFYDSVVVIEKRNNQCNKGLSLIVGEEIKTVSPKG